MGPNSPTTWASGVGTIWHSCWRPLSLLGKRYLHTGWTTGIQRIVNRFLGWDLWFLQHSLGMRMERGSFRKLRGEWPITHGSSPAEGWEGRVRPSEPRSCGFAMSRAGEVMQGEGVRTWVLFSASSSPPGGADIQKNHQGLQYVLVAHLDPRSLSHLLKKHSRELPPLVGSGSDA